MSLIDKTPAEFAAWIHEMYAVAVNPDAIPALVEDIIQDARDDGHDQGVEAVVQFLEAAENIRSGLQRLVDGALKLKKGAGE